MNPGQQKFYEFILERVQKPKLEDAKALLKESFHKQDEGTFDQEYLATFIPKMKEMIREENLEEVNQIMISFQDNWKR